MPFKPRLTPTPEEEDLTSPLVFSDSSLYTSNDIDNGLSMKYGSVAPILYEFFWSDRETLNLTLLPSPKKFFSFNPKFKVVLLREEYPTPILTLPVFFSFTVKIMSK